ncbi:MAG: DUF6064 family protein [Magnetovibrionaceae bacterium]
MPEWMSYSLSDFLMYGEATQARLYVRLNEAYPTLRLIGLGLGFGLLATGLAGRLGRAGLVLLGLIWFWVGYAYFPLYAEIMPWAGWLAALFYLQGGLLIFGALRHHRRQVSRRSLPYLLGTVLVVLGTVGYPLIGDQSFGLAPTPTALATLGLLLIFRARLWLSSIPLLWLAFHGLELLAFAQAS